MRDRAGSAIANDGEFFMPINLYHEYMYYTSISHNMDNVSTDYHLTLDSPFNNNTGEYCRHCTGYLFYVTTEET